MEKTFLSAATKVKDDEERRKTWRNDPADRVNLRINSFRDRSLLRREMVDELIQGGSLDLQDSTLIMYGYLSFLSDSIH